MPRRVLIVTATAERRGAETEASELAARLAPTIDARCVALVPGTVPGLAIDALGTSALGVATLRALRREARDADVVLAYGSTTLPACALALAGSTPFVYRSIGDPRAWVRSAVHRVRTGVMFHRAAHVVALWPGAAASIRSLYRLPEGRVSVIPNARDADLFTIPTAFERDAARVRYGIPAGTPVIAVVGALTEEKRPELAVRSALGVDGSIVLVAGDGPKRSAIEDIGGDRVRVLGSVSDVRPVYAAADVLVLASRTEGLPGVVIEAGLCGLPIVATDVGGVAGLIGADAGRVVPVDAPADAITEVLRETLGEARAPDAVRAAMAPYRWDTVLGAWAETMGTFPSA